VSATRKDPEAELQKHPSTPFDFLFYGSKKIACYRLGTKLEERYWKLQFHFLLRFQLLFGTKTAPQYSA
jgi:hypothetical protein